MIRKILPDIIKDIIRKVRTKPHEGYPEYGLLKSQVYPKGENLNKHFANEVKANFTNINFTKDTKVSSIGTCFAEEFSKFLVKFGGSYIYKEKNRFSSSANWGRVYNILNFEQVVNYSLTNKIPLIVEKCDKGFFDPLRDRACGYSNSENLAKEKILKHRTISKEIFENSEIIVITIGQNECWLDKEKNFVWGIIPPTDIYNTNKKRFLSVSPSIDTNVASLENSLKLIKKNNKKVKFILTVSPVPSHGTFTSKNVVTKSLLNKCILKYVVNNVIEKNNDLDIYYYPSFEMVLCDNPKSFMFDNRHVRKEVVQNIFDIFEIIIKK